MEKLTDKQADFVREYLVDLNATQAAIRAKYSKKTARQTGTENLAKPYIQEAIRKKQAKRAKRLQIKADYVLKRHVDIDEMDVADILNDDGSMLAIKEWPKCWRRTITGIDISEIINGEDITTVLKKIKWPDKLRNLELLGKHVNVQAYVGSQGPKEPETGAEDTLKKIADLLPD
ncbi:MAG: terminase small subunit [Bacteroides sp.]|nr:terminase small subunit [Bacteroides sp.]